MIGAMARSVNRLHGPVAAVHHVAIRKPLIRPEVQIRAFALDFVRQVVPLPVETRLFLRREIGRKIHPVGRVMGPHRAVRPEPVGAGAGPFLQAGCQRRMVAVGVGYQDMRHRLAGPQRRQHVVHVRRQRRSGIDHRHLAGADDVGARALVGERRRIPANDSPDQRRHPHDGAVVKLPHVAVVLDVHVLMAPLLRGGPS